MENVILDGGLDLVRARPAVLAGRIRECLNYEVSWERGYSRIEGFERFDGHTSPSATDYWIIIMPTDHITGVVADVVTDLEWVIGDRDGNSGTMVDYVDSPSIDGPVSSMAIVYRQGRLRPEWGSTISPEDNDDWSFVLDESVVSIYKLSEVHQQHDDFLNTLSIYADKLRQEVLAVPGGGTIVGLHYHEDQLYAIRDTLQITLETADAQQLEPGMYVYNMAGQVGEVVGVSEDGLTVNIAASYSDGFVLGTGEALSVALTVRFVDGQGTFNRTDGVLGATSAWAGEVGLVSQRDGSWDSQTALGTAAFIFGMDVAPTAGEVFDNTTAAGALTVETILFNHQTDLLVPASTSAQSDTAALWRSTDDGWEAATTGRVMGFDTGTNDPGSLVPIINNTLYNANASATTSTWADIQWSDPISNIHGAPDGTVTSASPWAGLSFHNSDALFAKDFRVGLPDKATINGIEVIVNCTTYENPKLIGMRLTVPRQSGTNYGNESQIVPATLGPEPLTFGSPTKNWGITSIDEINSYDFGPRLYLYNGSPTPVAGFVDSVQVKVWWEALPGSTLYLWDGISDVGTISVDGAVVQSGSWEDDDAAGYFRITDWSAVEIPTGTEVWTAPGGTGSFIANVTTNVSIPTLPGSQLLNDNKSKYQIISYNFYATEERNAIYGCSGAGPAWWYDGTTLDFITTGVAIEDDKPRHLAPHQQRLALGYIWGEVYTSQPGEPTLWDGALFAGTFGFGDRITGLMPIAGDALAVFTESSIWALKGAPGAETGAQQTVINHKVGAIEYTVQSMGNRPIFASFRGIETLETMDQYSDFFTAPLTYDVSPWLLRRLQSAAGVETTDESVVNSVVVRNKNQYRLFFADGYLLTLTHVGPEKEPQNTIQKYWFNSDQEQFLRVFATASGVSSSGQDHAFISAEERPNTPRTLSTVTPETDFVYELDRGRSFDGGSIEAHFHLTHNFSAQQSTPMLNKRYNVVHFHGTVAGYASLRMSRSVNYEDIDNPVLPYEDVYFGAEAMPPEDFPKPKYSKGRLTARGFAVSVYMSHESAIEFSHNIQLITFLNDEATKPNR